MPSASARSRSKRPDRGDARSALLGATLDLVRRHGWSATSIDDVCRAVGVTKGAFFHHFPSKEALGVAAAGHWTAITGPVFAEAPYHRLADPLDRILGYVDFRAALARGPLEAFTCFVGTTVQETFASSPAIRVACGDSISRHAESLVADFAAAIAKYPPRAAVSAESLALYTQTVVQGGFVVAKSQGERAPLLDSLTHLRNYLTLLFPKKRAA